MRSIQTALICELMKLKRSPIVLISIIIFIFIPFMMGLMIFVSRNPEVGAKLGLIAAKAKMFGYDDWESYFGIINQLIATMGLIGFGFVCSWVFGREFLEHTIKDILALPISRLSIVVAKYIIVLLWCSLLSIVLFAVGVVVGKMVDLEALTTDMILTLSSKFFLTAFMTLLVTTPVAFFASYGRGILAPIAFVIVTLIMAQFVALVGLGPYFPWAIPGVNTAPEGTVGMQLTAVSFIVVAITAIIGLYSTILYWRLADQQ